MGAQRIFGKAGFKCNTKRLSSMNSSFSAIHVINQNSSRKQTTPVILGSWLQLVHGASSETECRG